jgi:Putative beta barrel porin-7 (BBP7)
MRRLPAIALGVAMTILGLVRAEEVEWHAPRTRCESVPLPMPAPPPPALLFASPESASGSAGPTTFAAGLDEPSSSPALVEVQMSELEGSVLELPPASDEPAALNGARPSTRPAVTGPKPRYLPALRPQPVSAKPATSSPACTLERPVASVAITPVAPSLCAPICAENCNCSKGGRGAPVERTAPQRGYVDAEYLLWWVKDYNVPVLATTGIGNSTGVLGQPGTVVLFGPGDVKFGARSGGRLSGGYWLDDCHMCGVDGSIFVLGEQSFRFTATSNQFPRIARPFFSPNVNREVVETTTAPGLSTGGVAIVGSSDLWGAELNARHRCREGCASYLDLFAGGRYLNLSEQLNIIEGIVAGPQAPEPLGTRILVNDQFTTRDQFWGGQLGVRGERSWGRFFTNVRASIALGDTHQTLDIRGAQIIVRPGQPPQFFTGGLLAVSTNIGRFTRDEFSVVPEVALNVGYSITPRWRLFAGYSALFWSNVIRPGDQIDRVVDVTFVPNPPPGVAPSGQRRPTVLFQQSDLWVQGVNAGLEYRW